jgi:hypothetical protein
MHYEAPRDDNLKWRDVVTEAPGSHNQRTRAASRNAADGTDGELAAPGALAL